MFLRYGQSRDVQILYSLFSDLPSSGPKILGVDSKYHVGDQITASCIYPLSFPAAVLSWYINSDSADPGFVSNQSEMVIHQDSLFFSKMKAQLESFINQRSEADRSIEPNEYFHVYSSSIYQHLEASFTTPSDKRNKFNRNRHQKRNQVPYSVLKLNFTVKPKHLAYTEGSLSLKCTAEVLDIYWRSSEVETQVTSLPGTWSMPAFSNSVPANMNINHLSLVNLLGLLISFFYLI